MYEKILALSHRQLGAFFRFLAGMFAYQLTGHSRTYQATLYST